MLLTTRSLADVFQWVVTQALLLIMSELKQILQLIVLQLKRVTIQEISLVGDLCGLWDDNDYREHELLTLENNLQLITHIFKNTAMTALDWLHTQWQPKCKCKQSCHNNQQN